MGNNTGVASFLSGLGYKEPLRVDSVIYDGAVLRTVLIALHAYAYYVNRYDLILSEAECIRHCMQERITFDEFLRTTKHSKKVGKLEIAACINTRIFSKTSYCWFVAKYWSKSRLSTTFTGSDTWYNLRIDFSALNNGRSLFVDTCKVGDEDYKFLAQQDYFIPLFRTGTNIIDEISPYSRGRRVKTYIKQTLEYLCSMHALSTIPDWFLKEYLK